MSDDESAAVGPSPAKSIAVSVASTMASRKSTKESAVQAKVAAMSRAELEDGMLKLLSKLQAKEKQIKGMTPSAAHVTSVKGVNVDQERVHQEELRRMEVTIKGLKDQLKQQQVAFDNEKKISMTPPPPPFAPSGSLESWRERATEAEAKLATADSQVTTLIQASKESAMAHGEQVNELITELNQARLALEESQRAGQEMREKEQMLQQQLASLKEALRELGAEREAAFVALGEYKEQGLDQAAELTTQIKALEADLEARVREVESLTRRLEASEERAQRRVEGDLRDERDTSPDLFLPPPPTTVAVTQQLHDNVSLEPLFDTIASFERRESEPTVESIAVATDALRLALGIVQNQSVKVDSLLAELDSKAEEIKQLTSQLEKANGSLNHLESSPDLSSLIEAKDKEIIKLSGDLGETKKKLLAAAKKGIDEGKKRDQEARDMEGKLNDLSTKHQALLTEAAALRAESQELIALKAEKSQLTADAASRQKELEQAQSLMLEYKQLLAQKDNGANQALAKAEAEVKRVQLEMERALSKVESRLHEKELDCEGLLQQLSKAEKEASELRRAMEGKASGAVADLQAAKVEAEALRAELSAVKRELEGEKVRAAKALEEAKKRLNKAQKLQHAAELELAELKGKTVAEREGGKLEAALANQALETCRRDMERLEAELRDYKSRAQALLKQKDAEIKEARETLALTMIPIDKFSEVEAKLAAAERSLTESILAREELEESHLNSAEKERSMHASIVEKLEGRVKYYETLCNEAQKELDEWKKKSQALEARLNHHQSLDRDASLAAVQEAEEAKRSLAVARSELDRVRDELKTHQLLSDELMEAKDNEMLQLVRRHTLLHEELTSVKEQLAAVTSLQNSQKLSHSAASKQQEAESAIVSVDNRDERHDPEEGWANTEGWGSSLIPLSQPIPSGPAPSSLPQTIPLGSSSANLLESLMTNPGLHSQPNDESQDPDDVSTRELISSSHVFGGDEYDSRVSHQGALSGQSVTRDAESALALIKMVKELIDDASKATALLPHPPPPPIEETKALRISSSSSIEVGPFSAPALLRNSSILSHSESIDHKGSSSSSEYITALKMVTQFQSILTRNRQMEAELIEMEKELTLREEMEAALKESLREAERASVRLSRNTVDVEYLKNTVLKIYRTGDAEQLLPVFAMILAFSPEELKSCQLGLQALKESAVPLPAAAAAVDATLVGATSMLSFLWGGSSTK